jgi:clan AA aspartic protease
MSITYTEITLKNMEDMADAKRGRIKPSEARQVTVQAMVDTGSTDLVISEAIRQQLGLEIEGSEEIELANNQKEVFSITELVRVDWKDRSAGCKATVIPGDGEVLLGALPMEAMDLIIHPLKQEVVGAHGDKVLRMAK